MERYSLRELADMHLVYGAANQQGRTAARMYAERFPQRRHPAHTMFQRLDQRLGETGSLRPNMSETGRPRSVTPDVEEIILDVVADEPTISTREIARRLTLNQSLVWRILHEQLLYPFHPQRVQSLNPDDYPRRRQFCEWFLQQSAEIPQFASCVIFTDEATFTRDGIFNTHNQHIWEQVNPYAIAVRSHQQRFSVNVWCGIINDILLGPQVLPNRLSGEDYRDFLENTLPILLEEVPLAVRARMWFQHDGAPAHFSLIARQQLTATFGNRWIGYLGPVPWPARSPDLNPLDFFLWGHLKTLVYATPVDHVHDLLPRIVDACNTIRTTPGIFERVRQSMFRRCQYCVQENGRQFEAFL